MIPITEDTIRSYSSHQSFARGREYYHSGAIDNATRQGNTLLADCEGIYTYHVRVELDEGGIRSTTCTCPYDFDGYCKHIVALLLTYIHKPDEFSERKSLSTILEHMDKAALIATLTKLSDRHPELYDWLEAVIPPAAVVTVKGTESPPKPQSQVSEQVYRKRIQNILSHSQYEYNEYGSAFGVANQLDGVIDSAKELLKNDDARGAMIVLTTLLDEIHDAYEMYDDSDGDLSDVADAAGELLAEAILSANLTTQERSAFERKIKPLAKHLSAYGIDQGLGIAQLALEYGWDEPEDAEEDLEDLTQVKLNVLERQNQVEKFLALCQQTHRYLRCALKLVELGRIEEAIETANEQLTSADEILHVAKALREANRLQETVTLAERCLTIGTPSYALASWLAPLEESQGRTLQAEQAYLAAFTAQPTLESYKNIQRLSGERWMQIKPTLMQNMHQRGSSDAIASIYLYEQEWDQAIEIAQKNIYDYTLREKVADTVIKHRPDWVIQLSIGEAEKLIAQTQSKYYPHAVRWLEKVKQAYLQSGRPTEWTAFFTQLKTTYARRPSLQKELKKL